MQIKLNDSKETSTGRTKSIRLSTLVYWEDNCTNADHTLNPKLSDCQSIFIVFVSFVGYK